MNALMKRLLIPLFALAILVSCTPAKQGASSATVEEKATQAVQALKRKDLKALAALVHPVQGLRFTPYTYVNGGRNVFIYANDLPTALQDLNYHTWGEHAGSGEPITMTFAEYYDRFVYDEDYASAPEVTWDEPMDHGSMIDNAADAYPGSRIVEYHFPGFDEQYGGMDWRSLRLVWQELDGVPYLVGIIHDEWTP